MRYLKNMEFLFQKRDVLLARFVCGPYTHLKTRSAAVNATRSATRILLKGRRLEQQVNFFAQNLYNLVNCAEQTDATQAYHRESLGKSPQQLSNFCDFAAKNINFKAISITFRTFLKP